MSIVPDSNNTLANNVNITWLDQLAMSIVFKQFKKIESGFLQVFVGGMLYEFGHKTDHETDHKTDRKADLAKLHAVIRINNIKTFTAIIHGGEPAAGKSYVDGWWTSDDLVNVLRLFTINRNALSGFEFGLASIARYSNLVCGYFLRNNPPGSKKNIKAHYDIGNQLYKLFLDSRMMYSSAYFRHANEDLESASEYKLKLICEKLNLQDHDRVIEIGGGWGGFAVYAAQHYHCHITTTTISDEQYLYTRQLVASLKLSDKVTVIKKDYRLLTGQYDKLVSIEMIESVGHQYMHAYFSACSKLLKPCGAMLIQAITIADYLFADYIYSLDFIRKYVFPGGCLTSMTAMLACAAKHTDLTLHHSESFAASYAKTLQLWHRQFIQQKEQVLELGYPQTFIRLWEYYLKYCQAGFENSVIDVHHLLFKKPRNRFAYTLGDNQS